MPANSPAPVGLGEAAGEPDSASKGRGRTRYCKKCKFSCVDAREFTAHQTSHCDAASDLLIESDSPTHNDSGALKLTLKRVLRPKRKIKCPISATVMESPGEIPAGPTDEDIKTATKVEPVSAKADVNETLAHDGVKSEDLMSNSSTEPVDAMEEDMEEGDEPDAMTINSPNDVKHGQSFLDSFTKLPNGIVDNFSGDEDIDNEDRLVIDDGDASKPPSRFGNIQNRTYSCHQCDMTTTSAKCYLRHLNEDHQTEASIYECDLCDYATIYKQKLPRHRKLHFSQHEEEQFELSNDDKDDDKIEESNSFLNTSNSSKHNLTMDEDLDEDLDGAESPVDPSGSSIARTITADNIDQVLDEDKKKKKKTRQEVDPGKYFEAVDSSGTKYACSQCGNIYKWRKSLNKHWKEKHSLDPLVEVASPPGMLELLKSGKYTQLGARRIYDNAFLSTIKTNKNDDTPLSTSPQTPSPPNFFNTQQGLNSRIAPSMMPKIIGPYVASTAQPVFPGMPLALHSIPLSNGYDSPEEGALDLTRDSKPDSRASPYSVASGQEFNTSFDQDQPLDFSRKKEGLLRQIKVEESVALKQAHSINQLIPKVHRCSKCDYTSNSEVDFANHMSSHLGKRLVKCNECKLQISSMDELNSHFLKLHGRKLTEYKEAIKKIPHGLQQTYHLLKMDLNDISELGNQDLGAAEGKSLKCKKCDFEAKWPAELQKHAVSHSEERPYICMVCGSTYKWKWDLVKHFQKSHPNLPNPYRRNDKRDSPDGSSEEDAEEEPENKRQKMALNDLINGGSLYNRDDNISVEGIIAATQAGQRLISSQPNILDDEPNTERNLIFLRGLSFAVNGEAAQTQAAQIARAAQTAQEMHDRRNKAQKALQEAVKYRQSGGDTSISKKSGSARDPPSVSPTPAASKEVLPYKCPMCNYHARWPSEVTQHMKNHSDCKPYLCPRCDYRSKWKWDVVKHLKRCGGGGINDVIDTTKTKKKDVSVSNGPPNAIVSQHGQVQKMTPQPSHSYISSAIDESDHHSSLLLRSTTSQASTASSSDDLSRPGSRASTYDLSNGASNNNDSSANDNNTNNNYRAYSDGLTLANTNSSAHHTNTRSLSPMDDNGSSNSPVPSPVPQTSSSRQNCSGEIWKCPYCPFKTQSQAELKRHSGLHSDDKPFKCDVCQYSTRWACDLKKHRKSYNHYPAQVKSIKKEPEEKVKGRFKCTSCSIYFHTLHGLLEHRLAEHIGQDSNQSSPAPQNEHNEIDVARIKHPRKPIKQIQCSKCSFVCKSRQTMERHMQEHEQLENSVHYCFYCSSQFRDKESLLDHITTHSAFNPKEWETFFMINEEEEQQQLQQVKEETKALGGTISSHAAEEDKMGHFQKSAESRKKDLDKAMSANDSTEARIQQILNEVPKQLPSLQQHLTSQNKYKCEWCSAEFVNLTAVYKHARQAHPIQLKEQDVSLTTAPKSPPSHHHSSKKHYKGEPIEILRQQIAEKRNSQLPDKVSDMFSTSSKMCGVLGKKLDEDNTNKSYNCDKCSFSSASPITFQRHYELHGSKLPSQCWFCDYSVDRLDLLYQHMKISHTRKWKALSQDPKYASQMQKMNLAFACSGLGGNNNDSPPEHISDVMDLSSKGKHGEVTHDIMYCTRQQYTWSGIPVNVVPVGNALNFVCPHCAFNDASIAKTCAHVMQSHRAMSKFTCKKCQFYDDNIHVMSDHCKSSHPVHERIVEVLDFKQLNFSELQMVQLTAMRDSKGPIQATGELEKLGTMKAMSCPFCPFKSLITEQMKMHVSDHSKQARYRCQICDYSSDSKSAITDHVKVHEPNYTLDAPSITESIGMAHVKKEPSSKMVNEVDSKWSGKGQDPSETEPSAANLDGSPRTRLSKRIRYRCSACPFQNLCRTNIMKHRKQHNNGKNFQCPKCTYGAARAVLLKKHLESHDVLIEDDGQYHDIFVDPDSPDDVFKTEEHDEPDTEVAEMDVEEFDEDEANSELDEMDAKAIADLEAKDILEAEAAHKASILLDVETGDKQVRKQKCPHCPFSSNSGYEFQKHLNFHGFQERYKCDRCSYSLDRLNLLSQHRKLHSDEPGFNPSPPASDLLNTRFILQQSRSEEAEGDMESFCQEDAMCESVSTQFFCLSCPYKATKKKSLDIHSNSHRQHKRFICDFCDWSADRIGLLHQHRKVHEQEPQFTPSPDEKLLLNHEFDDGTSGEFEAKFMEIKTMDKMMMMKGDAEVSASPPFKLTVVKKSYPCPFCPFKTNSKNSFTFHKNMHNSGADFACSECSYAAVNAGLLQQHLHLHRTAELLSPTNSSMKSPVDAEDTKKHMNVESLSNKKNDLQHAQSECEDLARLEFKCQRCPFTASSQSILKEHSRGHTSLENWLCPYCDFSAVSKEIMLPHIQVHFPGTKLEQKALEQILEENNSESKNRNQKGHTAESSPESVKPDKASAQPEQEAVKTKRVYVCQFCEREFEAKDIMIQHEKQHFVGSH